VDSGSTGTLEPASTRMTVRSDTRNRRIGRALVASIGVTAAIQGLNLLTGILLARRLGPHGRGELTAVLLWPALLAVLGSLGVSDALTYYSARDETSVGSIVGSGLLLALLQALILIGVGVAIEPLVLHGYGPSAVRSADILLVGFIPANLFGLYLLGILNGRQHLVAAQLLRGLVILVTALVLVTLLVLGKLSVRTAVFGYIAANLFTTLVIALVLWRREHPRPTIRPELIRRIATFGLKSQTSTASVILNNTLDQLLVSLTLAPRLLGLYTIAATVGAVISLVGYSVAPVALPVLAGTTGASARHDGARAMIGMTMVVSLVLAVPLIVLAPVLVDLVFGPAFHGAATPARILLAGSVIFSTNRALEAALKAFGRPLDAGLAETTALVVTAGSLAALLPLFGLAGAASASGVGALASYSLLVWRARSGLGLSVSELLIPRPSDLVRAVQMARSVARRGANSAIPGV
jgi:O-antigen/teichoic acid export membrane protein